MKDAIVKAIVGTLLSLNPAEIILGHNARRHGMKDQPINDLLEKIGRDGQQTPGQVWQDDQGKFHLTFGYRRLKTCQELNIPFTLRIVSGTFSRRRRNLGTAISTKISVRKQRSQTG